MLNAHHLDGKIVECKIRRCFYQNKKHTDLSQHDRAVQQQRLIFLVLTDEWLRVNEEYFLDVLHEENISAIP